jgi:hypothetical protein
MIEYDAFYSDEPPAPVRGATREERGRDISDPQALVEGQPSAWRRLLASMHPRFVWSMADGYPSGLRQFLQLCLVLIYPAWLAGVAFAAIVYGGVYSVLWVMFWPVRAWMKRNRPEEYAASQQK